MLGKTRAIYRRDWKKWRKRWEMFVCLKRLGMQSSRSRHMSVTSLPDWDIPYQQHRLRFQGRELAILKKVRRVVFYNKRVFITMPETLQLEAKLKKLRKATFIKVARATRIKKMASFTYVRAQTRVEPLWKRSGNNTHVIYWSHNEREQLHPFVI